MEFFTAQASSDAAVAQNEKAYAEIVLKADKRRYAVNDLIRDQEKATLSRAGELVDRLEKEISELRKREDQLKQLSLIEDHINFLQVRKQSNTWIILCAGQQLMMCLLFCMFTALPDHF